MKDKKSGGIVKFALDSRSGDMYSLQLDKWLTTYFLCAKAEVNNWPKINLEKRAVRRGLVKNVVVPEVFL